MLEKSPAVFLKEISKIVANETAKKKSRINSPLIPQNSAAEIAGEFPKEFSKKLSQQLPNELTNNFPKYCRINFSKNCLRIKIMNE